MVARVVIQRGDDLEAVLRVERRSLECERHEMHLPATPPASVLFGGPKQSRSNCCPRRAASTQSWRMITSPGSGLAGISGRKVTGPRLLRHAQNRNVPFFSAQLEPASNRPEELLRRSDGPHQAM